MNEDWHEDGLAAYEADMLKRREDEELALLRVSRGVATTRDVEILADGLGLDIRKLKEAA